MQAAAQIILKLLNLFIVILKDTIDDHRYEEQWPLALKALKLLQLAGLIVATRFVLRFAKKTIACKTLETHFAAQPIDHVLFGLLHQAIFMRGKGWEGERQQQRCIHALKARGFYTFGYMS